MGRSRIALLAVVVLAGATLSQAAPGSAYWSAPSIDGGGGGASATRVDQGSRPVPAATQSAVSLTWQATTLATGQPVAGYVVRRYDSAALSEQVVGDGCSATITSTSCVETATPNGSWVYTVTPRFGTYWQGAESDPSEVVVVDADVVTPVNNLTVVPITGGTALSGTTVYYRGAAAGSMSLANAVSDNGSGPASSRTHTMTGDAAGWTHSASAVSTPTGGPYESNPFAWTAGTSGTPGELVTGSDIAGNTADTTLTFSNDSTPPADGTLSYPDGTQTDLTVSVSFTTGSDSGSGIASRRLQVGSSTMTGPSCDGFGAFVDLGAVDPVAPVIDTALVAGHCYHYRYVVLDRVGNQRITISANVVTVIEPSDGGPPLGSSRSFSVLGGTGVANTGATTISGDLGVSPSIVISGFPPGIVAGTTHTADTVADQARADFLVAYDDADGRVPDTEFSGDQNGRTFLPGIHHSTAAFALTGTMTLDGQGDPNALFIFQVDAALNTAANSHVVLVDGATASHVYWQALGAAGTGADSSFAGTILANGAITLGAGSELIGRALSAGTVTLASNTIRFTNAPPPLITIDGGASAVTKDPTPTISGTTDAVPGTVVRVAVEGQALTASTQVDGTWTATAAALTSGVHQVVASVGDAAGNATSASQMLTVEINPDPVDLRSAASFSVVSGGAVANLGASELAGDLAAHTSVSGFPPGIVWGAVHVGDAGSDQASTDVSDAYDELQARAPDLELSGDQIGKTFHAGIYHSSAAFALTGTMTLDGEGNADAIFIFQISAAMSPGAGSEVVLVNGAQAGNVYWQVVGATSVGAASTLVGTILSNGAVTLGAGTNLTGRVLSFGDVSLSSNGI